MLDDILRKDVDLAVSVFADKTVMYLLNPPLRFKTGDNSPSVLGVKDWFDSFEGPIIISHHKLEVIRDNEVAFRHSLDLLTGQRTDET